MNNVVFQDEDFNDIFEEAFELMQKHFEEINYKCANELDLNENLYKRLAEANALHICTARLKDSGKLIAYACYLLAPSLHHKQLQSASADGFFMLKEYRKGLVGVNLLKTVEEQLRDKGIDIIIQKVKVENDCSVIFRRLQYQQIETVWLKNL